MIINFLFFFFILICINYLYFINLFIEEKLSRIIFLLFLEENGYGSIFHLSFLIQSALKSVINDGINI
jgi:hypothetical protein